MKKVLLAFGAFLALVVMAFGAMMGSVFAGVDEGPGGPVLLITSASNAFSRYYTEILRAEGLNHFSVADIASVSQAVLNTFDVAILGEMPLTYVGQAPSGPAMDRCS